MKTCQTSINRMSFYLALREVWVWSQCSFLCRWCFQPFAPNLRLLPRKRGKTNLQKTWNFRRCDVDAVGDKSKNLTSEPQIHIPHSTRLTSCVVNLGWPNFGWKFQQRFPCFIKLSDWAVISRSCQEVNCLTTKLWLIFWHHWLT